MRLRWFLSAFLAMQCLMPSGAQAQAECTKLPWTCFGEFELRIATKPKSQTARMIHFSNQDFMAEIERDGKVKRYLRVIPPDLDLYSGLADNETPGVGANNPFFMLDMAFALPARALQAAYPLGMRSIPVGTSEQALVVDKKFFCTLKTTRVSADKVEFHLAVRDEAMPAFDGSWDGKLRAPLGDDYALDGWQYTAKKRLTNLGEARVLPKTP